MAAFERLPITATESSMRAALFEQALRFYKSLGASVLDCWTAA